MADYSTLNSFYPRINEISKIKFLIENDNFLTLRDFELINKKCYEEYTLHEINHLLDCANSELIVIKNRRNIMGLALLEPAKWDTHYFGIPMAKMKYFVATKGSYELVTKTKKKLLLDFLKKCKEKKIKHISTRIDIEDYTSCQILEENGFKLMCVEGVNIIQEINPDIRLKKEFVSYSIRKFEKKDTTQLIDIARDLTQVLKSHYYFDNSLSRDKVYNYYVENVRNCCKGYNADFIVVAEKDKKVLGFLAYNISESFYQIVGYKMASVVLFAVNPSVRGTDFSFSFILSATRLVLKQANFVIGNVYLYNIRMIKLLAKISPNSYPFIRYLCCFHKWL